MHACLYVFVSKCELFFFICFQNPAKIENHNSIPQLEQSHKTEVESMIFGNDNCIPHPRVIGNPLENEVNIFQLLNETINSMNS